MAASAPTAEDQPLLLNGGTGRPGINPWVVAATVTIATFMEVLDTSIANVALPHIAGSLAASRSEAAWVLTSYLVSNAIVLPLNAFFSQWIGRKNYYMGCVAVFTLSSLACGLAPNLGMLVIFRILQGAGGGGLQPSEQAILVDTFPGKKRGMAMAFYGIVVVLAPIIGPTLGGYITDHYTWRWIFFINVPVGMLSLFLSYQFLQDPPDMARKSRKQGLRIDYIGLGLLSVGLGFLQIMLDRGQQDDWFESHFILLCAALAIGGIIGAFIWEWFQDDPIVDFHLLAERNFGMTTLGMLIFGGVLFGSTVLLPLFVQTLLGYTAMEAGLVISPGGVVVLLLMPLVGFSLGRVQARWLILIGVALNVYALWQMGHFDLHVNYYTVAWDRGVQAAGLAFLFVPINTVAYAFIPKNKTNNASGIINLARNVGGSVGISLSTAFISRISQKKQAHLVGHVSNFNPTYHSALRHMTKALAGHGGLYSATIRAQALIYKQVQGQAHVLAYVDVFRTLSLMFLIMVPVVFLMKHTDPRQQAGGGH